MLVAAILITTIVTIMKMNERIWTLSRREIIQAVMHGSAMIEAIRTPVALLATRQNSANGRMATAAASQRQRACSIAHQIMSTEISNVSAAVSPAAFFDPANPANANPPSFQTTQRPNRTLISV
ncbi:hypothetical protein GCM10010833_33580 [Blastomonas aquatica]|uniref:Uncharacterized protein n=1 Tax=Blastomonas aquatica TaxID=1510276 RepID=A0ABQ1JRA5_9SPHN|nr:hypothetical protein GCM10010833_33580 [Blastomonas aquatica]